MPSIGTSGRFTSVPSGRIGEEVVSVSRLKGGKFRVRIGADSFLLVERAYVELMPYKGKKVSPEEKARYLELEKEGRVLAFGEGLAIRRRLSPMKMYRALLKKAEGNKALAMKVQGILKEEGLIDERAFAEEYAEEHSFRGVGPRRILEGLAEEGVSSETRASLSLKEDEKKARDYLPLMERKFGFLPKRERVEKGTGFLVRKGFSEGLSRKVSSEIRENSQERKKYLKTTFLKIRTRLEGRYNDGEVRSRVRLALLGKGFSLQEIEEEERSHEQDR